MSVPYNKHWLSTKIRRDRKSFAIASLILWGLHVVKGILLTGVFATIAANLAGESPGTDSDPGVILSAVGGGIAGIILSLILTVILTVFYALLSAQRFRDMGVTGWIALIWIPILWFSSVFYVVTALITIIILTMIPGTKGKNKYGADPLGKK